MKFDLSKIEFISAMAIFGTIGLFVRYIPLPSAVIAMCRGFIGAALLCVYIAINKKPFSFKAISKNFYKLLLSGAFMGFNWIFLFESYKYTTIAKATLCYYMAPVFIIIISPFAFKEKITVKKVICIVSSFVGMLLVSDVFGKSSMSSSEMTGLVLGILAALTYTVIIALNKTLTCIGAFEKTVVQLLSCGTVMLVYSLVSGGFSGLSASKSGIVFLFIVCLVHTGIAYLLYFGSFERIKAQNIAILSYVDPVVAVLASALILREPLGITGIIGAVLIIGSVILV